MNNVSYSLSKEQTKDNFFFFCLLFFIFIIYSNTFHVPFHFDDLHQIQEREEIRLSKFTPNKIINTFFDNSETGRRLYRPISSFSFALNYYFGGYNPTGYHLVNISIHIVATFFLYLALLIILDYVNINATRVSDKKNIAGFATLLWASHPINTQAITYIVQRMASLSTMFYIIGIWGYLKFRADYNAQNKIVFENNKSSSFIALTNFKHLFISIFAFLCACLSKENAAIFPICILLIEFFIFNGAEKIRAYPKSSLFIVIFLIFIPLIIALSFYHIKGIDISLSGYNERPFTLKQRFLTEFRIVIFYISQLLYPTPDRFSLEHFFVLSDSISNPISTLLSIILILILVVSSLLLKKKYPLIGFSILFYFIHHIIESTILPLELVFEHRNYMPSLFFFLPVSIGIFKAINLYNNKGNKTLKNIIIMFSIMLLFLFGISTHTRNNEWLTSKSLWESALRYGALSTRPYNNLGHIYTNRNRSNVSLALHYFEQGLNKELSYTIFEKAVLWLNIATSNMEIKNFQKADQAILNSLNIIFEQIKKKPESRDSNAAKMFISNSYFILSQIYFYSDIDKAIFNIEKALSFDSEPNFYNTKATLLIHKRDYEKALTTLQNSLEVNIHLSNMDDFFSETYFLIGKALTSLEHYERGLWFYKLALNRLTPADESYFYAKLYFHIADNRYMAGKTEEGDKYIKMGISIMPVYNVLNYLNSKELNDVPFVNKDNIIQNTKKFVETAVYTYFFNP